MGRAGLKVVIRAYAEADKRETLQIIGKGFTNREASLARYHFGINADKGRKHVWVGLKRFVALVNGRIVGTAGTYRSVYYPKQFMALDWEAVLSEFQGIGIGTLLLNRSIKYAKSKGARWLFVYSTKNAMGFYKKLKFAKSSRTLKPVEDGILYERKIA